MPDRLTHNGQYTTARIKENDELGQLNSQCATHSAYLRSVIWLKTSLLKVISSTFGCISELSRALYNFFKESVRCKLEQLYKREHVKTKGRVHYKEEEQDEDYESLKRRLEKERFEKEDALERIAESLIEVKRLESLLEKERFEKEDALERLEKESDEKEKALTRLSAVAGDKLRLNNPDIADLSEENRPNKLAEKFSELYDNEWTEVFEVLEEEQFEEEEIIEMRLELIKGIFNSCKKISKERRDHLIDVISRQSKSKVQKEISPEGMMSKAVDLRKKLMSSVTISDVKNTIFQRKSMFQFTSHGVKQNYVDRCVQLCWMMSIQDPPMMLDFGPGQDEEIDKNTFRMYTRQGDRVGFIVWPAVFLHENGPLVQKGVFQPKVVN